VHAVAPDGAPEIVAGDDLATVVLSLLGPGGLVDGDVVVVTSKAVSKAEGRVVPGHRDEHLAAATARVVARRGPTTIVRTHHGLVLAAGGIDNSNVEAGSSVLLPLDPDGSARRLRAALHERTGVVVGVVVTDTAGRAWREGQTDIAIGAAGVVVAEDFAGRRDGHGNELAVTAPAVADEIAGLAELAQGKLGGRPVAVVRGRPDLVLPADDDGPGAAALVRPEGGDLFGYGAREAVVRAVRGLAADRAPFGSPVTAAELAAVVEEALGVTAAVHGPDDVRCPADPDHDTAAGRRTALQVLAHAHGWTLGTSTDGGTDLRCRPVTP
jgi:coenzyme F420-0:L-glutamate ligase/coenzyme F420-1:gamma-L-glutamate ligase